MKKLLSLLILTLSISWAGNAFAVNIAVVNMKKLWDGSTAANTIREQSKKERDQYQASLSKEEEALRKEDGKLNEQRNVLTQDAFSEKRRQFNEKVAKVQREFQEKRASQEGAFKTSLDQVHKAILSIIDKIAKEEGYELILQDAQILYSTPTLDITDKVLERLNKTLPTLKLGKESNG